MISYSRLTRKSARSPTPALSLETSDGWFPGERSMKITPEAALKSSAFYRAIDLRTDSLGKYPVKVMDLRTRREVEDHYLGPTLWARANEAMCPFVYNKLVEYKRLVLGNSYVWIYRDRNGRPVERIPLPHGTCIPFLEPGTGKLWYVARNPKSGEMHKLSPADILHYKGFSTNGIEGISLLAYAEQTLSVSNTREAYERAVYANGGHPAGVLYTETDLSSKPEISLPDGTTVSMKDIVRKEWDRIHAGADNAFRIAVLDNGLKYQGLSMSNSDAQFVESKAVTVEDVARFTGVPMHKLFTGKQAYNSNEANSIDYIVDTQQPTVTQYEQEDSYKLLTASELLAGLWLKRNMMAELRGDSKARGDWYRTMRDLGAYSVNDMLRKEDEPDVPGGDTRMASLNYVPLELFRELSIARNSKSEGGAT